MSLRESDVFRPRKRRRRPERAVQNACLAVLRELGCLVAVTDAGAAYRARSFWADTVPAGWPDITGLMPDGRFIGVECKARRGRQLESQKRIEREIRRRNGIYILARGAEDVRKALDHACHD